MSNGKMNDTFRLKLIEEKKKMSSKDLLIVEKARTRRMSIGIGVLYFSAIWLIFAFSMPYFGKVVEAGTHSSGFSVLATAYLVFGFVFIEWLIKYFLALVIIFLLAKVLEYIWVGSETLRKEKKILTKFRDKTKRLRDGRE